MNQLKKQKQPQSKFLRGKFSWKKLAWLVPQGLSNTMCDLLLIEMTLSSTLVIFEYQAYCVKRNLCLSFTLGRMIEEQQSQGEQICTDALTLSLLLPLWFCVLCVLTGLLCPQLWHRILAESPALESIMEI